MTAEEFDKLKTAALKKSDVSSVISLASLQQRPGESIADLGARVHGSVKASGVIKEEYLARETKKLFVNGLRELSLKEMIVSLDELTLPSTH